MGKRTCLAAGSVIAFLTFDFVAPVLPIYREPWAMLAVSAVLGVIVGQINLIATWGAVGPGNVVTRLPWSILLGTLTWYATILGLRVWLPRALNDPDLVSVGPLILFGIVVTQIPLWIARKSFRWRLINLEDENSDLEDGPLQFSIRHVLLLVALALGPAQLVLPSMRLRALFYHVDELVALLAMLVVTNLIIAVPCGWSALVKSIPFPPQIWIVFCAVVTAAEVGVFWLAFAPVSVGLIEVLPAFFLFNLLQCATVYFTLRLFRATGYRLVRVYPT